MEQTTSMKKLNWLENMQELVDNASAAVGNFRVQMALGEAEAVQKYAEQKKKVNDYLNDAERFVNNLINEKPAPVDVLPELTRARIKLDILRLHYHFSELSAEVQQLKIAELKQRINLVPENVGLHDHLLSVEEEIKAASVLVSEATKTN